MKRNRNKQVRPVRLDAPGDNWPVLDLELIEAARRESLLVARLRRQHGKLGGRSGAGR